MAPETFLDRTLLVIAVIATALIVLAAMAFVQDLYYSWKAQRAWREIAREIERWRRELEPPLVPYHPNCRSAWTPIVVELKRPTPTRFGLEIRDG